MIHGLKMSGWKQGIYETSPDKREAIGTLRILHDGRKFRYARASTTQLEIGMLCSALSAGVANLNNQAVAAGSVAAINDKTITFIAGGNVTYAEDYFEGGYWWVQDGTAQGHSRRIEQSGVVTSGTDILITLDHPILTASVAAASEHSMICSPYMCTVVCATVSLHIVGLPPAVIPASHYYWTQTQGFTAGCIDDNTAVAGAALMPDTDDGEIILNDAFTEMQVGYMGPAVGVADEKLPIYLTLEGM